MKEIPIQQAVGMVLGHDVTRIVPGTYKGPAFKKGYIIQAEDIPLFLDLGKQRIFVFEMAEGQLHENEAARRIAQAASGDGLTLSEPSEGKINLVAAQAGLLKINVASLHQINHIEEIVLATLHSHQPVNAGQIVAGTRIIPLVIDEQKIHTVEAVCRDNHPVLEIRPFVPHQVGIVTTGSEVYHGRIEDKFGPVVQAKLIELGSTILRQVLVSDDVAMTVGAIHDLIRDGADMVAVTGGMSVDPDDQTPASIRAAGARVVTYGAPVLPGAMFMLAYIGQVPVLGLPGCVMYHRTSIFDLMVPRILAGETVTRADITTMGHGGLCAACEDCRFPHCAFGK